MNAKIILISWITKGVTANRTKKALVEMITAAKDDPWLIPACGVTLTEMSRLNPKRWHKLKTQFFKVYQHEWERFIKETKK